MKKIDEYLHIEIIWHDVGFGPKLTVVLVD